MGFQFRGRKINRSAHCENGLFRFVSGAPGRLIQLGFTRRDELMGEPCKINAQVLPCVGYTHIYLRQEWTANAMRSVC